jgi:uncharacterized membrane protein
MSVVSMIGRRATPIAAKGIGRAHRPGCGASPRLRALVVIGFVASGTLHFAGTSFYRKIMPPWLPLHRELIWLSGVAEIVGGIGLAHPRTRRAAGWWLMATVIVVFPANIHMARNPGRFPWVPGGKYTLWARLPVQGLFLAMVRAAMR